jgi:hypothetical protein
MPTNAIPMSQPIIDDPLEKDAVKPEHMNIINRNKAA